MSLYDTLRSDLEMSVRERNEIKKNILRVVLGDISTLEMKKNSSGKKCSDEQIHRIIRTIVAGNTETINYLTPGRGSYEKLLRENEILASYLPTSLSKQEIRVILESVETEIKSAKTSGLAVGTAIKFLKQNGHKAENMIVAETVGDIRGFLETV